MPIRFRCIGCRQLLSIGRRKAGAEIQCPKCGRLQRVPSQEEAGAALAAEAAARSQPSPPMPSGIFIFDEEPEDDAWTGTGTASSSTSVVSGVVGVGSAPPASGEGFPPTSPLGPHFASSTKELIWISRRRLYWEAVLIFLVGIGGFGLGYWLGWADNPARSRPVEPEQPTGPIFVEGRLFYRPKPLDVKPDEGAVAIFLPADRIPEERFVTIGLRPQDPPLEPSHPTLQAISRFGGAYARTDAEGNFLVQLPAPGEYYMCLISRRARSSQPDMAEPVLVEMKKYFPEPKNLIDQAKFHWTRLTVRPGMPPIEHDFDR